MHRLRFFFDPRSGTCLWAADADTSAALGYAVDHHALPLSGQTRALLDTLIAQFDTSLDWDALPDPAPSWTPAVEAAFLRTADHAARQVAAELLPAGFTLVTEHRGAAG